MKGFFIFFFIALYSLTFSQSILDEQPTLDSYLAKFSDGIPTATQVESLKNSAITYYNANDCVNAIPTLETLAKQANNLANFYRQTLEPFYSSTRNDRDDFSISMIPNLVASEDKANNWVITRNNSWVMLGSCYEKTGDYQRALGYYLQALDHISTQIEEIPLWNQAGEGILRIIDR